MANPAKRKGTAFESAVRDYLNSEGIPARRVAQAGRYDEGDLHGVDPFILECKAYANVADGLRDGVDQAVSEAVNAGKEYGAAVIKRPRRSVGSAYVAMPLSEFVRLLLEVRRGRGIA